MLIARGAGYKFGWLWGSLGLFGAAVPGWRPVKDRARRSTCNPTVTLLGLRLLFAFAYASTEVVRGGLTRSTTALGTSPIWAWAASATRGTMSTGFLLKAAAGVGSHNAPYEIYAIGACPLIAL